MTESADRGPNLHQPFFDALQAGELAHHMEYFGDRIKEAFVKVEAVYCSDGRIDPASDDLPGAIRTPGPVFGEDPEKFADNIKKHGAENAEFSSHEHCGAARHQYMQDHPGSNPTWDEVDRYAQERIRTYCELHGFHYRGHIKTEGLKGEHNEQVMYLDMTTVDGQVFDPSQLGNELPKGFVFSGRFSTDLVGFIALLKSIKDVPVVVVASSEGELQKTIETLRKELKTPVDGFVVEK